jgi:hypothetical protein
MESSEGTTIRSEDVEALASRLQPFIEGLPEQEQQVLGWILVRARSAGANAAEGDIAPSISTSLAQAAGFEEDAGQALMSSGGNEITVSWKHSF